MDNDRKILSKVLIRVSSDMSDCQISAESRLNRSMTIDLEVMEVQTNSLNVPKGITKNKSRERFIGLIKKTSCANIFKTS